jgi:hypothetical protein
MTIFDSLTLLRKDFNRLQLIFSLLTNVEILATIVFFLHKSFLFLGNMLKNIYFLDSNAIFLAKSNIISELKGNTAQIKKLFQGGNYQILGGFDRGNYSKEETIQGRKLSIFRRF